MAFTFHREYVFEKPANFPEPVYNFDKNPLSDSKILLGRALFYDPILSRNNTISCSSCHSQFNAFAHADHALSHGIDDMIGFRNAPAIINVAWQKSFMFDGAVHHLDVLPLAPIHNAIEMDEKIENVVIKLGESKVYKKLYEKAYGDTIVTGERTLKALSQFMLTLVSSHTKYDSVMQQQAVFTEKEEKGYTIFKKHCASCHTEPLFTNDQFYNNGLKVDTLILDYGRYRVTLQSTDSLKFKVPTLRNIEYTFPYMHDGRFKRLSQVINHYTSGIVDAPTLAAELKFPIQLNSNEKVELINFLLTLSDKSFLFDKKYGYPKELFLVPPKD